MPEDDLLDLMRGHGHDPIVVKGDDPAVVHEALATALDRRAAEAARHLVLAGRNDLAAGKLLQAAQDAARATAFVQAATFQEEACRLAPGEAAPLLALADTYAMLGRSDAATAALEAALERLDPALSTPRAEAPLQAARWYRSSLCDPANAGMSAQRGLDALGDDDAGSELRFELLAIRAWSEVTHRGVDAGDATLAELDRLAEELELERRPLLRYHLDMVRGFALIARGKLAEAELVLLRTGEAGEAAGRPDLAYAGWGNAAAAAAGGSRGAADKTGLERAVGYADLAFERARGLPTIELQVYAVRGYLLSRLERHEEAAAVIDMAADLAERLGQPDLCALAAHDRGMLALAAGDNERAAELLGTALDGDPPIIRAEARLRRAEALARCARPDEADAEIRAATQEPMRASYKPIALVARMAFVQALSARARGDHELARRRFDESAEQWRRLAPAAADHLASMVDLGRLPGLGVIDPDRELTRIEEELHARV
jgi:tetratricopeptide (TPR) repeat protein